MSVTKTEVRRKPDSIKVKFAERTRVDADELTAICSLTDRLDVSNVEKIRSIAFRIAGTAALFGFPGLTDPAAYLEQLIIDEKPEHEIRTEAEAFARTLWSEIGLQAAS